MRARVALLLALALLAGGAAACGRYGPPTRRPTGLEPPAASPAVEEGTAQAECEEPEDRP